VQFSMHVPHLGLLWRWGMGLWGRKLRCRGRRGQHDFWSAGRLNHVGLLRGGDVAWLDATWACVYKNKGLDK